MNSSSAVLDFSAYITERTRDFAGREWVFDALHYWRADLKRSRGEA